MLNKDPDIFLEENPLIFLDSKYDMCMANNGNYTKHTRHLSRRIHFVRNGENCKMHKIDWFEGGLQFADISNKSFGEHDLKPIMKYIMVILDNWDITLVQDVLQNTG